MEMAAGALGGGWGSGRGRGPGPTPSRRGRPGCRASAVTLHNIIKIKYNQKKYITQSPPLRVEEEGPGVGHLPEALLYIPYNATKYNVLCILCNVTKYNML